jgi:DNA replication protein DnaC
MVNQTIKQLQELKLNGFIHALKEQQENPKYQQLSFDDRLGFLVDTEHTRRQNLRLKRRLSEAKLKQASTVENVDFVTQRKLDKKTFLELAACTWVLNKHNLFITGPTGVGKSFIACSLADKACRLGLRSYYIKTADLVTQLLLAREEGTYYKLAQKLAKTHLLIIDEWLLHPLTQQHAREMLDLLDNRFRNASTIFASQLPVCDWHKTIQDQTLADAILDRLVHDAFRLELDGDSMRKLTAKIAM